MKLDKVIAINTLYTRSVNIERDSDELDSIRNYIPTQRSKELIKNVLESSSSNKPLVPRSWSLIGPYGAGKSSAAVFLTNLFSQSESEKSIIARNVLQFNDKELSKSVEESGLSSQGVLKVILTGAPEPLGKKIILSLLEGLRSFQENCKQKDNNLSVLIEEIEAIACNTKISSSEVIGLIRKAQKALENLSKGIFIIIDEFGKFLEYEARTYDANEIYLLQMLAEEACQTNSVNIYLFVLLHQSFDNYAKGLGGNLRKEWSKIQGRFEEINFVDTTEQTLGVVGKAIEKSLTEVDKKSILNEISEIVEVLDREKAIPVTLAKKEAIDLFYQCYPLHPISALLLPQLTQKIAQNERTLFSYIGSMEEYGLKSMLQERVVGEWIKPADIYNYFVENQTSINSDHLTNKRWVEVITAIERLTPRNTKDLEVLKTIGVLNISGSKAGFKASSKLLALLVEREQLDISLKELQCQSIVNHRKYNNEYRVWQGSDFDLDEAVLKELDSLGPFSLVDELNKSDILQPLVVRRYTIESGALRYFVPYFIDANTYSKQVTKSDENMIFIYISNGQDDVSVFDSKVLMGFDSSDLVAHCKIGIQLREVVGEYQSLIRVGDNYKELYSDPIAKREFEERLSNIEFLKDEMISSLLNDPGQMQWYYKSELLSIKDSSDLQKNMSEVLHDIYSSCPVIKNELINRDRPSAQAVAARNKLLLAMIENENEIDLGIEKFPPEKAIYRSVLREAGFHKENKEGIYAFHGVVDAKHDKLNFIDVWSLIERFVESTESKPKSFVELNEKLMSPPYGLKAGILPILYVLSYLVHRSELAIYEGSIYRPRFDADTLERFNKRPDDFYFQLFRIQGVKSKLFEKYSSLFGDSSKSISTIIDLAEPIAKFMNSLPEYTLKTRKGLSTNSVNLRKAFELARSPEDLLFRDLPKALGFYEIQNQEDTENLDEFIETLRNSFRDLNHCYRSLIKDQISYMAVCFGEHREVSLNNLRNTLVRRFEGLEKFTADSRGVKGLLIRIANQKGSDDEWLENILIFLSKKASKKWNDQDRDNSEFRLRELSTHVLDLEKIKVKSGIETNGNEMSLLLRSVRSDGTAHDEVIRIDSDKEEYVRQQAFTLLEQLRSNLDLQEQTKVLAYAVDTFLKLKSKSDNNGVDNE